jgi:hypothetical protein
METKPITQSVTIWSAMAMLLSTLLQQTGIVASAEDIEHAILLIVQVGSALLVIWRRLRGANLPLQGWWK